MRYHIDRERRRSLWRQLAAGDAPGLAIEGLALARGMRVIQPSLTHRMAAGEITLVTGPNGSGKSTSFSRCGRQAGGRCRQRFPRRADALCRACRRAGVGSVRPPQSDRLGRAQRVCRCHSGRVDTALARLAASGFAELPVRLLSRGQRRRLALARLALSPPDALWLLDEPTAGLDDASRQAVDALIADHLAAGGMVMAATHDPLATACGPRELVLEAAP